MGVLHLSSHAVGHWGPLRPLQHRIPHHHPSFLNSAPEKNLGPSSYISQWVVADWPISLVHYSTACLFPSSLVPN